MSAKAFGDLAHRDTERHLLLAVDESENSRRAVLYVADFFGDYRDVFITLLTIFPEPSEDYFPNGKERRQWMEEKEAAITGRLNEFKEILLGAGFTDRQVATRIVRRPCASIGDAILEEQEKLRCCIVVMGRRGISHSEEFIFGSTSNRVLHHAKHCAVMVVE